MPPEINLSPLKLAKYREQLSVPGMSAAAQQRLLNSSALILGISGPGAYAARSLAAFGLGRLTLVEENIKSLNELKKSISGPSTTRADTNLILKVATFKDLHLEELVADCDVVIDSLRDWQDKLRLSDICMSIQRPLIHAGIVGFRYQIFSMLPGKSACLRCALPLAGIDDVPLIPPAMGQIQAVSEMVGAWQAIECVKVVAAIGATQGNELLKIDCLSGEFDIVRGLDPRSDCPDCGSRKKRRVIKT